MVSFLTPDTKGLFYLNVSAHNTNIMNLPCIVLNTIMNDLSQDFDVMSHKILT